MEEITFFAIICNSRLTTIISGAEFVIAYDTDLKTACAFYDGNYGGIYAIKIS
jgi:hypothetical protein